MKKLFRSLFPLSLALAGLAPACAPQRVPSQGPAPMPPARPALTPSDLEGVAAASLQGLLGDPDLQRMEGTGEFRQYGFDSCSLLVFAYPDAAGVMRVAHLAAAARRGADPDPTVADCLAEAGS